MVSLVVDSLAAPQSETNAMGTIINFPAKPALDHELATSQMLLLMAGLRHSSEYRRLDDEIRRRRSNQNAVSPIRATR